MKLMNIYILLDEVIKGPFSLATLREMLSAGAIQQTTLVALEGGDVWTTVNSFLAERSNAAGAIGGVPKPIKMVRSSNQKKWYSRRIVRILIVFIIGSGIWFYRAPYKRDGNSKMHSSSHVDDSDPQKQTANRGAYNAYMEGYNNPELGDTAEVIISRYSGEERKVAILMILGSKDRRCGLPIRFKVVE